MIIEESHIRFNFREEMTVKFDDTQFYRKYFNKFPHSKGVDVLSSCTSYILFMEIKNFSGTENDNAWRCACNNQKIESAPAHVDKDSKQSVDIEVVEKVAMTISCLTGGLTKHSQCEAAEKVFGYSKSLVDNKIDKGTKKFLIILFIEGIHDSKMRSKKIIMKEIRDSIETKLAWLNCKVLVVDSSINISKYVTIVE